MTYGDIYEQFCKKFPKAKVIETIVDEFSEQQTESEENE